MKKRELLNTIRESLKKRRQPEKYSFKEEKKRLQNKIEDLEYSNHMMIERLDAVECKHNYLCENLQALAAGQFETVYEAISAELDPNGFFLFQAAEEYTHVNIYSFYPIEDNLGLFEDMNGNELLPWLESAAFGTREWEPIAPGAELSVNRVVHYETEEYETYKTQVYCRAVSRLLDLPSSCVECRIVVGEEKK